MKGREADVKFNDPLEALICCPDDYRLSTLLQFCDMALKMCCKKGKRVKRLSNDTAKWIHHTCYDTVELSKHLLATSHVYVLLGIFTSFDLEKDFGKLRQVSRGTFFIIVRQVIKKLHISHTPLLLSLNTNIDSFDFTSDHECDSCTYVLCEAGSEMFDNLEKLESSIPNTTKASLIYTAGYVYRNEYNENDLFEQTLLCYEKFDVYLKSIDRGGLKIPPDHVYQRVFFNLSYFI